MQSTCANCGKPFTCGAGSGSCWCMDLPKVSPMPENPAGCFCRECLTRSQSTVKLPIVTETKEPRTQ